jgi:hypothetical protein
VEPIIEGHFFPFIIFYICHVKLVVFKIVQAWDGETWKTSKTSVISEDPKLARIFLFLMAYVFLMMTHNFFYGFGLFVLCVLLHYILKIYSKFLKVIILLLASPILCCVLLRLLLVNSCSWFKYWQHIMWEVVVGPIRYTYFFDMN